MTWEFVFLDFLQSMSNPVLDGIFSTVTHLGDGGLFWIALGIVLLCFKGTRKWGACVLVALAVGALVCNVTLKPLIARDRPFWINEGVQLLVKAPGDFSFPSGHSQASFAAATAIFMNKKSWGILALVVAALVAFSRLYLYIHFPTDVLAGVAIGILMGILSKYIVEKFLLWRQKKAA